MSRNEDQKYPRISGLLFLALFGVAGKLALRPCVPPRRLVWQGVFLLTALILSSPACAGGGEERTKATVIVKGTSFSVKLAETPEEQARGLSGRTFLGPNEGMLFLYPKRGPLTFWMKEMLISIDMIWLDNTEVVHIESDVPFPAPGTPNSKLPTYASPTPANGVLEIAAGRARGLGLVVGDHVSISFGAH